MPTFVMPSDSSCAPGSSGAAFFMPNGGNVGCPNAYRFYAACGQRVKRKDNFYVDVRYRQPDSCIPELQNRISGIGTVGGPFGGLDITRHDGVYQLASFSRNEIILYDPLTGSITDRKTDCSGITASFQDLRCDRNGKTWDIWGIQDGTGTASMPSGGKGGIIRWSGENLNLLTAYGGKYSGGQSVGFYPPVGNYLVSNLQRSNSWAIFEDTPTMWAEFQYRDGGENPAVIPFPNPDSTASAFLAFVNPASPWSFPGGDTITSSPDGWYPIPNSFADDTVDYTRPSLWVVDSRKNVWLWQEVNNDIGDGAKPTLWHLDVSGKGTWTKVHEDTVYGNDYSGGTPREYTFRAFAPGKDGFMYAIGVGAGNSRLDNIIIKLDPDTRTIVDRKVFSVTSDLLWPATGWDAFGGGDLFTDNCGCIWLPNGRLDPVTMDYTDEPDLFVGDEHFICQKVEAFDNRVYSASGREIAEVERACKEGDPICDCVDKENTYPWTVHTKRPTSYWRMGEIETTSVLDHVFVDSTYTAYLEVALSGDFTQGVAGLVTDDDGAVQFGPTAGVGWGVAWAKEAVGGYSAGPWKHIGNNGAYTIEAWVTTMVTTNLNAAGIHGDRTIIEWRSRDTAATRQSAPFNVGIEGNVVSFGRAQDIGTNDERVNGVSAINNGLPHHVVVTVDGNSWAIYVDGSPDNSGTFTTAIGDLSLFDGSEVGYSANMIVGAAATDGGGLPATIDSNSAWQGVIDEVAVYHRALSAAEVLENYNKG